MTINNTTIELDGITAYMRRQSTTDATLSFSDAARTILELDYTPIGASFVWLFVNGVFQTYISHWTISGDTITLLAGVPAGQDVSLLYLSTTPGAAAESIQTGTIVGWHAAVSVPDGFLDCNGAAVSRTTYAALFSKIGTTYGVGDGSTTFNLPTRDMTYYNGSLLYDMAMIKT